MEMVPQASRDLRAGRMILERYFSMLLRTFPPVASTMPKLTSCAMLAGVMAFGDVRKKYKHMPWRPYKKIHFLILNFQTFLYFVEKIGKNECHYCIQSTKDIKEITFEKQNSLSMCRCILASQRMYSFLKILKANVIFSVIQTKEIQ